jgi:APA family basic amino acid/polyamine antiporter
MSGLRRSLGLSSTIAIVAGGIIGSGVFMKPALMMSQLGSPVWLLEVWALAGIITLFGALSNAELAAQFPETGGQYVFFQKIYGEQFAYLYGWAAFAVFNTAGNASVAYVCATYLGYFFPLPHFSDTLSQSVVWHIPLIGDILPLDNAGIKLLTILLVLLLTWLNYYSLGRSAALQRLLTWIKLLAIVLLVVGLFSSSQGTFGHYSEKLVSQPTGWVALAAWMAALSGAFWGYDGWNNITFIAGEIKDPRRNIPISLFAGLLICILVYVILNASFAYVLSPEKMAVSSWVASDAAFAAAGKTGALVITLLVVISTLGAANGNILSTARVTFAWGASQSAFSWAAKVHPRFHTPGNALWLNGAWTTVLIISGSFDMLTDMLIFVSWFFYGMSILGMMILRHRFPRAERGYRVPGYPWVPLIFVIFTAAFLVITLVTDVQQYWQGKSRLIHSLLGVGITLVGLPLFYLSKKRKGA